MTDESNQDGAPAQSGAAANPDQADQGTQRVDLEKAVAELARKNEREARKRVSLDLIENPEHRKIAEALASQAVTEYRRKLEEGKDDDFLRKNDVETMLRNERKMMRAEQEAREKFRDLLSELGIQKGTEDYTKFEAAAAYISPAKLAEREAVELVAKAVGVGKFKPKDEPLTDKGRPVALPTSGVSLRPQVPDKTTGKAPVDPEQVEYEKLVAEHARRQGRK